MRVLAMASQKGGSGKTTLSGHLAVQAERAGAGPVVLIDIDPQGVVRAESHAECHGRIRFKSAGTNGFGYDPLFEVVEYHRTFGELGPDVKRAISHRARAMRAILPEVVGALRVP